MIDHLVLAGPDLDGLVAWFVAVSGVDPAPGGAHVGLGTRNALVGVGGPTYLELIGPDPDQPEPDAPRPFGVDELEEPRFVTWCLAGERPPFLELKKGGACLVRFDDGPGQNKGRLIWLAPPAILRHI